MGKKKKAKSSTRKLIGIKDISEFSLVTYNTGELVFFLVKPTNLSVLSEDNIRERVYSLMNVIKGISEMEMYAYSSRENFDANKRYLKKRINEETNPVIRKLLEKDLEHLDNIQIEMATSREFAVMVRLRNENEKEIMPYLNRVEKILKEQGFMAKRAARDDIKRILAVYFEQNVTQESFADYDGEQWLSEEDEVKEIV